MSVFDTISASNSLNDFTKKKKKNSHSFVTVLEAKVYSVLIKTNQTWESTKTLRLVDY